MTIRRAIRVAVIDSGVNARHPHIASIAGGVSIESPKTPGPEAYLDTLGHGTAVMAAIQDKAPDAEYFAVKLFHRSLAANAASLLKSIQWCVDHEMDVVNMSLGTTNPEHANSLRALVEQALKRNVALVAAREWNGERYYPGSLPGVIPVGLDWDVDRDSFRVERTTEGPVFYASGYPRPIPGVPPRRNLHGISFAVANMTGLVIRAAVSLPEVSVGAIHAALIRSECPPRDMPQHSD